MSFVTSELSRGLETSRGRAAGTSVKNQGSDNQ
jgi:hypothetical protein